MARVIPDEVPGFRVEVVSGFIEFNIHGRKITLTKKEAGEIANALADVDPRCWLELENKNLHLEIRRRGRGLVVRFPWKRKNATIADRSFSVYDTVDSPRSFAIHGARLG
jgi:hypothetical protein